MMEIKNENYYVVHGWMRTDLKLTGISLQVYAIIHGFSQDDKSVYNGGKQYLMDWCGCSRQQVINVLKEMTDNGLIERIPAKIHNRDGFAYRVVKSVDQSNKLTSQKSTLVKLVDQNQSNELTSTSQISLPELVKSVDPSSHSPSYSPNDLPPAPYNKDIKNDIKKNKKEEDNARATAHSFSFQENGKAIIAIPCTDGELTFSGEDVKDLQAAFVDLNIIAELKQIVLKVKTAKVEMTADRARRYVTSWMVNSQNKRASSCNLWQSSSLQTMSPDDPKNPFTHPEYDKDGNKLDYDGNIIKTAQEIRAERKAEEDRKEAERIAELDRQLSPEARAALAETEALNRAARLARQAKQAEQAEQAKKHPKKPYWEMSEDELKAQLKPLQGEQLWQYQVRTEKIKNQLLRLEKIRAQQEKEAVNA